MTIASIQATPSPASNEPDPGQLRAVGEQKEKVQALDRDANRASTWNHVVLGAAALIAVLIVIVSQWGRRADRRVREAESLLNALEMAKITSDADRKIALDTQKVRNEAASALALKAEEVRGEAGQKIEEAKAEAGVKIEQARVEAARQIGDVQKDVSAQQERAINAEKELAQLQLLVAWRTITPEQKQRFLVAVKDLPKGKIEIVAPDGDPEAIIFANQLLDLLKEAGWDAKAHSVTPVGSTPIRLNLLLPHIGSFPPNDPVLHAALLFHALKEIGLDIVATESKGQEPDKAVLWVGHRPPPSK